MLFPYLRLVSSSNLLFLADSKVPPLFLPLPAPPHLHAPEHDVRMRVLGTGVYVQLLLVVTVTHLVAGEHTEDGLGGVRSAATRRGGVSLSWYKRSNVR